MNNQTSTTRGRSQPTAAIPPNARDHEAHNHTITQSASPVQESRSGSGPKAGNPDPSSLDAERPLQVSKPAMKRSNTYSSSSDTQRPPQTSTTTTMRNTSVIQESKSGPKAVNLLSTDPSSFDAQKPPQASTPTILRSSTDPSSSDTQNRPQASTTATTQDASIVPKSKSGPKAGNLIGTDSSSSNVQKPPQASTLTILRSSTDPSSSNGRRPPQANMTTTSLPPPPPQQSSLDTDKPSKVSSSSNTGGEQPRTQNRNPPPRDEGLYTTVELQERRLKTLEDKLDKLNENIHAKEEKRWTFQLWPVMAASYHYHSPASTMETPESDIETPVEESGPEDTARAQSNEREAETMGNRPPSAHPSIVVTGNTTGPKLIPVSREPEYPCKTPLDPNPVPNPDADVEKLRLKKLIVDLTAKQEVLQSENNRLSATVSSLEKRSLDHDYLLASHKELDTMIKMHRCPTGDELDCTNSELRLDFEDLEMMIEELIDNCDTLSIDLKSILHMSRLCLANAVPSWWNKVVDEEKKKLWLRGLLANALHAGFFERNFYSDLDGKGRLEEGLIDFENVIFRENSGGMISSLTSSLHFRFGGNAKACIVEKRVALEWRARTFRLATELMDRNEQSRNTRVREVFEKLKAIFEHSFDTDTDAAFNHLESLREICEKALHCSSLLRRSTSTYTWDQRSTPRSITGQGVSLEKIRTTCSSNGAPAPPFNVFAEVLKLRRNNAIEQILKPTVAVFLI
ncbi:uncharacterized protein PAC_01393 [Phialocephala subalpina]|uniref:Uncharacterized protein n=1 Tax=Phialocephala subalpina TaxID=576137 RepID=A0A1L7WFG5_9HELO|nr:uncharacterized protein PAC_01393 [Phialocephala subalpina]